MPGNSKKNGNPVSAGKNQVALDEDKRGTFQEVFDPKNATVLGTNGNVTVSGSELDTLISQIEAALGDDTDVRQVLIDIGVIDDNGTQDTTDDTAQIGDVVDLGDGNDVMWGDDNQPETTGNDIILGGEGNDQLRGDGGNDALFGEEGNDVLNGDEGDDYMTGGTGNDVYHVDSANDIVVENADEGEDTIVSRMFETDVDLGDYPNIENGTLHEDAGESDLEGTDEDNVLIGNSFNNVISGLGGDDTIFGLGGEDTIDGGAGNDLIEGGADADVIDGGDDNDTASYVSSDAAVDVNLLDDTASGGHAEGDELDNIENLIGSAFDDTLTGDAGANVIDGGDGVDSITGGDGADTLIGGDGGDNDTINAGTSGAANGRDQDVDVIVAAASFAENGTDAVFNYEESTFPGLTTDDIFDFSAFIDFTDAGVADDDELANFLTYVEDVTDPATQNSTVGQIQDNLLNVWFTVSELDSSTAFNGAESVTVLVDGTMFEWNAATDEWDFA